MSRVQGLEKTFETHKVVNLDSKRVCVCQDSIIIDFDIYGEFDPGSERTLAACLIHASLTRKSDFGWVSKVANG